MPQNETSLDRPIPDLQPRPITMDQYHNFTPEKLELIEGYLIWSDAFDERLDLLSLLLVNEGLAEAVRLAPAELWRAALREVYSEP